MSSSCKCLKNLSVILEALSAASWQTYHININIYPFLPKIQILNEQKNWENRGK